jgi:signal transduction histidine kinase/CheY-like chemotaxis protein
MSKNPIFIKSLEDSYVGDIAKETAKNEIRNILKLHKEFSNIFIEVNNRPLLVKQEHLLQSLSYNFVNDRIEMSKIVKRNDNYYIYLKTPISSFNHTNTFLTLEISLKDFLYISFSPLTVLTDFSFSIKKSKETIFESANKFNTEHSLTIKSKHLNFSYKNYVANTNTRTIAQSIFNMTLFLTILTYLITIGFIIFIFSLYILDPIKKIISASRTFEENKINTLELDDSSEEFFQLTHQLCNMKTTIIQNIDLIKRSNNQLEDLVSKRTHDLNVSLLKEKKAAQAKTDFLANMSHELRTPLNSIIGFSEILHEESIDSTSKEYLSNIVSSGHFLLTLVNDILDITKIESNQMTLNIVTFDLKEMFKSIDEMLFSFPKYSSKNVKLNIEKNLEQSIRTDQGKLKQILNNLISNSFKFSSNEREIKVNIKVYSKKDLPGKIFFSIDDNGIGISKDDRVHLFTAFQQGDLSLKKKYQGIGLGLFISKKLVNVLNGNITIIEKEGNGTLVEFYIENKENKNNILTVNPKNVSTLPFNTHASILIVEDNKINLKLLTKILNKKGFENIKTAEDGVQGLEIAKEKQFDLIFMDLQMPKMDGLTSTKLILDYYREKNHLKIPIIVAVTANAFIEDEQSCYEVGMKFYLRKPIDKDKLDYILSQTVYIKKAS